MQHAILATAQSVEEAFYEAMRRGDLAGVMALWADDDDVVCVHPGGVRLVGLKAIRDGFETMFQNGGVDVHPVQTRAYQEGTLAVHTLDEKVWMIGGGRTTILDYPATNVYVKGPAGWRIILHQAGPGIEKAGGGFTSESATLH